jgi:DNA gyrase inhibitor GyrI
MAQIKVIHDPSGEPMTIYRDNPEHEDQLRYHVMVKSNQTRR